MIDEHAEMTLEWVEHSVCARVCTEPKVIMVFFKALKMLYICFCAKSVFKFVESVFCPMAMETPF